MIMIAITFICIACEGSAYFSLDHQKMTNLNKFGINYKLKTIGYFNTEKEAKEARKYYCENQ